MSEDRGVADLVTLSKSHPKFEEYLLGTFSETQRALPIQTLNVNTPREQVTFKILRDEDIQSPPAWFVWLKVLRPWQLGALLLSIAIILISPGVSIPRWEIAALSVLGTICLYISLYLRNDFHDHCYGIDRLQSTGGTQVIQRGWLRAVTVSRASWIFFVVGLLLGLPVVFSSPLILLLVGVMTFLGVLGLSLRTWGLKYRIGSEALSFLLMGPLLSIGLGLAVFGEWDLQWIYIGLILGALSLFAIFNRNLEQILGSSQAQVRNLMNYLGFDRSKSFLKFWVIATVSMYFIFQIAYIHASVVVIAAVVATRFVYRYLQELRKVDSCVGSGLADLRALAQTIQFAFLLSWLLGLLIDLKGS